MPKKQSQIVNEKEKKDITWKDICAEKENKIRFAFTASVQQIKWKINEHFEFKRMKQESKRIKEAKMYERMNEKKQQGGKN